MTPAKKDDTNGGEDEKYDKYGNRNYTAMERAEWHEGGDATARMVVTAERRLRDSYPAFGSAP